MATVDYKQFIQISEQIHPWILTVNTLFFVLHLLVRESVLAVPRFGFKEIINAVDNV